MKKIALITSLLTVVSMAPAHAKGCIPGAIAGGVAGHMAHHGVLGAIGGCVVGHQYAKHRDRIPQQQQTDTDRSSATYAR